MGTSCAPLVGALLSLCYEREFMFSLSDNGLQIRMRIEILFSLFLI